MSKQGQYNQYAKLRLRQKKGMEMR